MEVVVGALAAWGLLMLLWTLLGLCLLPLQRRKDLRITVVVSSEENSSVLERYLKGLLWLRDLGLVWWQIVVLMKCRPEKRELLPECFDRVELMTPDEFKNWME